MYLKIDGIPSIFLFEQVKSIHTKYMKKIIYFYIIYSFFAVLVNMAHPVTPEFFNILQFGSSIYGFSFALMAFFNFITSLLWADLTQRYGSSKMLILSFVGFGVAQFLFLITTNLWMLMLARSLAGIFMGGLMVASLSYILSISHNVTYLSIYALIQTVGSAVGYFVGGFFGRYGYQMTFYIQIGGSFVAAILAFLLLDKHFDITSKPKPMTYNPIKLLFVQLKSASKPLKIFLLSVFFTCFGYFMHDNWLNYYFIHHYQFASDSIGYYKLAIAAVSLAANLILIFFLSRYNRLLVIVLSGCGIMLSAAYFNALLVPFLISTLLYYMFSVLFLPLQQNQMRQNRQKSSSDQSGLFNSARSLGMMIGPAFSGYLYQFGDQLTLLMAAASFFLAACLSAVYFYRSN